MNVWVVCVEKRLQKKQNGVLGDFANRTRQKKRSMADMCGVEVKLSHAIQDGIIIENRYNLSDGTRIRLESASIDDIPNIVRVVNEAYMVDAYFKKPGKANRIDVKGVEDMIQRQDDPTSQFCLFGLFTDEEYTSRDLVGVFMSEIRFSTREKVCYFGLLAVNQRYKGLGYGSLVLNNIIVQIARAYHCQTVELLSISEAEKLRQWYRTECGFEVVERIEAPQELLDIILPSYDIFFWKMRKVL